VLQTKDWELNKNLQELRITKRAMLNVLEDFESEKHKLVAEKAKDEAILASIGQGLVVTDKNRRVEYINQVAQQLVGHTLTELRGKLWPEVLPSTNEQGEATPVNETVLERALATASVVSSRRAQYYTRADGSKFPVSVTASPILVNKQPVGGIVVFMDVTIETEIDRVKTEFVSLASHQLRTPLSTVSWYTEMLLSGDAGVLKADQKLYVQEVYDANRRMVELVNALLNVSRLELGTFSVEPIPTNLAEQAKTVLKELEHQISEKHLRLSEKYDPALPVLPADPNLISIIFQNLLSNAVKYTPAKGAVSFTLDQAKKGQVFGGKKLEQDSITIEVKDTGYGIPAKQQHLIFTKLFRADNVKEKGTDGTGLGLYIVKSILDQAGGMIHFVSRQNKGTTFFVSLPLTGMQQRTGSKRLSAAREHV
ncbi:MAG: PAS domain-containing sensor histidine kinase, partial [Parcubacteria group bacterium]